MARHTDIIVFWTFLISNFLMKHKSSAAGSDSFFRQVLPCLKTEAEHMPKRRDPLQIIRRTESKKIEGYISAAFTN